VTGIGLGVLWIGYTAFAFGHALTKGANVTFSDMVLPSHRSYALEQIKHAQLPTAPQPGVAGSITQDILGFLSGGLIGNSKTSPINLAQGK